MARNLQLDEGQSGKYASTMGVNENLTKRDVALGGKIRCAGCGGEWWLSGPQAESLRVNGWPTKCGNHPDVPVSGGRDDCDDETELVFVPYNIEENQKAFRAKAAECVLAAEAKLAQAKGAGVKNVDAAALRAEAAQMAKLARHYSDAADSIPEQAARIIAAVESAAANDEVVADLGARLASVEADTSKKV